MITLQIRVSGRVQGVGYRDALRHEAQSRGVTGWVRNRADGSVEALLQGSPEAVNGLVEWARQGPPAASVRALHTAAPEHEFDRPYARFERWSSV